MCSLLLIIIVHGSVGGAILILCCRVLNWVARGNSGQPELQPEFTEEDRRSAALRNVDPDIENSNPYAAPAEYSVPAQLALNPTVVPVPKFFHAFFIVTIWLFSYGIAFGIVGQLAESILARNTPLVGVVVSLLGLLLAFVMLSGILSARLPTKFPKACLVALMYTLTGVIGLFLGGCVYGMVVTFFRLSAPV